MKFKGDIIITDPCYILKDEDYYNDSMKEFGLTNFIESDTLYGDWSCTTFNTDNNEELGKFCADAGMVGVFLLDEVVDYNPDFDYHTEKPWTTTLIKDFDGDVEIKTVVNKYGEEEVRVFGKGNVNFVGLQTGY